MTSANRTGSGVATASRAPLTRGPDRATRSSARNTHATTSATPRGTPGLARQVALGLGVLSVMIGAAETLAPIRVTRAMGLSSSERFARIVGVREFAVGLGLLTFRRKTPWLWMRAAGDTMDAAALAAGVFRARRGATGWAFATIGAILAMDVWAAEANAWRRQGG